MKPADVRLARVAGRQHSVVTVAQAVGAGLSRRQVDIRLSAGVLLPVFRGVYRMAGAPVTPEQTVMAACLAARGVASHRCAASLWELRGFDRPFVEVTAVCARAPELPGVVAHRTKVLAPVDVTKRHGIPVTTPARTLWDLGAVVGVDAVESALEDALLRRLVTPSWLATTVSRLRRPGSHGGGVLQRILDERDPVAAPTESELEDAMLAVLRRAGLPEPARQHAVQVPGARALRVDFAYPEMRLAIEVDGLRWHAARQDFERDRSRANALTHLGWRLLRFTASDLRRRPGSVAAAVAHEVATTYRAASLSS